MILNLAIFTATVAAAKTKAAGNAALLRAIERAVIEIQKAPYWSFADGILTIISTTSGERYVIGDNHTCPANSRTCKHLVARRLMVLYSERLASAPAAPAIVIEETPRGFRFTLPYAPCAGALGGLKQIVTGYHRPGTGEPYRLIPAEKLQATIELLIYWFGEYRDGVNRHSRPACDVCVERAAPVADDHAALVAEVKKAWHKARPFASITWPLLQMFGVRDLNAVGKDDLKRIHAALQR